jgi:hypothetical protein
MANPESLVTIAEEMLQRHAAGTLHEARWPWGSYEIEAREDERSREQGWFYLYAHLLNGKVPHAKFGFSWELFKKNPTGSLESLVRAGREQLDPVCR